MKIIALKSSSLAVFCLFFALDCNAASSLFSNYGQIQNVQNYSSNPFWTPNNSSYHQGLPRPVYAQGTDLDTAECTNAVQSLVAVQCMARDNCKNTPLSEIRPAVMVQLSSLPNHNYVTACSGYIDGIYEKYIEYYGNNSPKKTSFPSGTTPNKNLVNTTNQIENPYRQNTPKWRTEINQRAAELEELQRQNGGDDIGLDANSFPMTYADLSFSERIANEKAGLEPYKDLKPYRELNVKSASEWCNEGEHKNSKECIAFFCSPGGPREMEPDCISWRCAKEDYYQAHQQECDTNKYCRDNKKSNACMQLRCYADDANEEDCKQWKCLNDMDYYNENITYCDCIENDSDACMNHRCHGEDADTAECKQWLCDHDLDYYDANKYTECNADRDCTTEQKKRDSHVTKAEIDIDTGVCETKVCEDGWHAEAIDDSKREILKGLGVRNIKVKNWCFEDDIIMHISGDSGTNSTSGCFNRCGMTMIFGDDAVNKALHKKLLLSSDKAICTISGLPGFYYDDGVYNKEFVLPKSKKDELIQAISPIKCNRQLFAPRYYIVIKDKQTGQALSKQMYIVE